MIHQYTHRSWDIISTSASSFTTANTNGSWGSRSWSLGNCAQYVVTSHVYKRIKSRRFNSSPMFHCNIISANEPFTSMLTNIWPLSCNGRDRYQGCPSCPKGKVRGWWLNFRFRWTRKSYGISAGIIRAGSNSRYFLWCMRINQAFAFFQGTSKCAFLSVISDSKLYTDVPTLLCNLLNQSSSNLQESISCCIQAILDPEISLQVFFWSIFVSTNFMTEERNWSFFFLVIPRSPIRATIGKLSALKRTYCHIYFWNL